MDQTRQFALVLLFALTALFVAGSIHFEYALPYHIDSFDRLVFARQIVEAQSVSSLFGNDWEIGYHLLLAILFSVTGLDAQWLGLVFPVLSSFLMGLFGYLLVRSLTKSNLAGLLCAVLTFCLASNMTVLGPMLLVPMAFSIALAPALLLFFVRGLESKKYALLLVPLLATLALIHPAYLAMLLVVFGVFMVLNFRLLLKNQLKTAIGILVLFLLLPFFAQRLELASFGFSPDNFRELFEKMTVKLNWENLESWNPKYFFDEYLGQTLFFVSMAGLGIICMLSLLGFSKRLKEKLPNIFEKNNAAILAVFFLALLPFYLQFNLTDNVFVFPYPRLFMLLYYSALLLAGIALFALLFFLDKLSSLAGEGFAEKIVSFCIAALFLFFLVFQLATQPFEFKETFYKAISSADIPVLFWLKENVPQNETVLASYRNIMAIEAIAGNKIVEVGRTRMAIDPAQRLLEGTNEIKIKEFFASGCEKKKELLLELKARVVATEQKIDCDFLEKKLDNKGFFVYYSGIKP